MTNIKQFPKMRQMLFDALYLSYARKLPQNDSYHGPLTQSFSIMLIVVLHKRLFPISERVKSLLIVLSSHTN